MTVSPCDLKDYGAILPEASYRYRNHNQNAAHRVLSDEPSSSSLLEPATTHSLAGSWVATTRSNDAFAWTASVDVDRSYVANGLNQYTAAGAASFSYDGQGNLTGDGVNSYAYDIENRLVGASGAHSAALRYDPLGRLYEVSGPAGLTRFLNDGDALVGEYDASGTLLRRYVHGADSAADDPIAWYEGPGFAATNERQLRPDWHASIVLVADSAGAVLGVNRYDEYGIPQSGNIGRFQYTGQAWLAELGMSYYKARFYSPTLGRFLQTDPIGYKDQVRASAHAKICASYTQGMAADEAGRYEVGRDQSRTPNGASS
jgi:RHS repeat-associated protein